MAFQLKADMESGKFIWPGHRLRSKRSGPSSLDLAPLMQSCLAPMDVLKGLQLTVGASLFQLELETLRFQIKFSR